MILARRAAVKQIPSATIAERRAVGYARGRRCSCRPGSDPRQARR
jgi:hypothetical protein